jgi:hypothetical protein
VVAKEPNSPVLKVTGAVNIRQKQQKTEVLFHLHTERSQDCLKAEGLMPVIQNIYKVIQNHNKIKN